MVRVFKNKDDGAWQNYFREEFIRKMSRDEQLGLFPWKGPIVMQLYFLYHPPNNWWPGKEKISTPDADNLGKQVLDALKPKATGGFGAFVDDRQVILASAHKFYHPKGDAVVVQMRLYEDVEKPRKVRGSKAP